ncbi:MAG: hypothetical protein FJ280_11460 [Planctomycetes bacterium]|nr:hypothetical protein [Planctomycetota bacterium]
MFEVRSGSSKSTINHQPSNGTPWALVFGLWLLLAGGCHNASSNDPAAVDVVVEGGGTFPISLAGRWTDRQEGWEFQLEPDGRISAAILSFGRVRVTPGQTTTVPTRSGQQAVFTPGRWTVHYVPRTRELTIRLTMDHVRVDLGGSVLEGSSTDVFVGPVAPTGRAWQAQWTTFPRYLARTADRVSADLSTDPVQGETRPLLFEKSGLQDL